MGYKREVKTMSPRTGRPTDNKKGAPIHIRLDEKSEEILDLYSKQENVSRADVVRRGIYKLESDIKNKVRAAPTTVRSYFMPLYRSIINLLYHTSYGFSMQKNLGGIFMPKSRFPIGDAGELLGRRLFSQPIKMAAVPLGDVDPHIKAERLQSR